MAPRWLQAAVLALLLVTAGCLSTAGAASPAAENDATRTIDVSATGTATADPDLAVVDVAVEVRAGTADEARERAAADVASMRAALSDLGIPDDAVRTTSFHVGPEYDHTRDGRELTGYRAIHAFEIESDVDAAGEVIDAAVENGASRVQGVRFTFSEETRRELRDEALAQAMANARADAETIASAGGVSLGPLHSASTSDVGYPRPIPMVAEAGGGDGARTVVEPGPVEVTAAVSAAYEIQ